MKASLLTAMAIDDALAEVHGMLANVHFVHDWDWASAEKEFQRAIQLNQNYADGHFFYSDFLISMNRPSEAMAELERALELDPFNAFYQCFRGWYLLYLGRDDDALVELRRVLRTEPNFPAARQGLWGALYRKDVSDEALKAAKEFFSVLGRTEVTEALTHGATESDYRKAMGVAAERLAARAKKTYVGAVRVARLYAHAGKKAQALEWLERAFDEREPALVHLAVAWDWHTLRAEPRFQDLLRKLNLVADRPPSS